MDVILGIHKQPHFRRLLLKNNWENYPFVGLGIDIKIYHTVIDVVESALKICSHIHFCLDGIKLPIDAVHSYTCKELSLILDNPAYYNKVTFYYEGHIINIKDVRRLVDLSVTDEGEPLKFSSLIQTENERVLCIQ